MDRFVGRTVLVTGAASGIGRATVERLVSEGARVLAFDRDAEGLAALAAASTGASDEGGSAVSTFVGDVADPDNVETAVAAAGALGGGHFDALVNSAGILRFSHTHQASLDDWDRVLRVNLTGTFLMCRAALRGFVDRGAGVIVNISSTGALSGHPWAAAYGASKGGVLGLTSTIAVEYGKQGIRANAVAPGAVTTPIHDMFELPEGADAKLLRRMMPLDSFKGPEVVASTVAFLASDDAAHINGAVLKIDGGMLA